MRARVATIQNTDPWAKSGVMIRQSTAQLNCGTIHAAGAIALGNNTTLDSGFLRLPEHSRREQPDR